MDDLIKRQSILDSFKRICDTYCEDKKHGLAICRSCYLDDAISIVENLPSEQQWIPCSERLPEKLEDVVICFADAPEESDVAYMRKTFNKTYKSQGCENEFVSHMGETTYADYEVLAWMPFPKWEGEKDESL